MKRVPLSTIKAFDDDNLPIVNTIFGAYGQSINDLSYGCMYTYMAGSTVAISASGSFTYVTGLSATLCSGFTFQNGRELLCNNEGTYLITWNLAAASVCATDLVIGTIGVNASASSPGLVHLSRGDIVSLLVENYNSANNILIQTVSLSIVKIDD